MFDGLKIFCPSVDSQRWETHADLDFVLPVQAKTGEVLPETRRAAFRAMSFEVTPSPKTGRAWCKAKGSLHRYANDGGANGGDFPFAEMAAAVFEWCERFDVIPKEAYLENVEFGLNIVLPCPAKTVLDSLICHGNDLFAPIDREFPSMGKMVARQQYTLKLYDKGKQLARAAKNQNQTPNPSTPSPEPQTPNPFPANVLRVEIHVSKMIYLHSYQIQTMADLTNPEKVRPLGQLLQKVLSGIYAFDANAKSLNLNDRDRATLEQWKNPLFWAKLDKNNRHKKRGKFLAFIAKNGANEALTNVCKTAPEMWEKLMVETPLKGRQNGNADNSETQVKGDLLTVKIKGEKVAFQVGEILTHKRVEFSNFLPTVAPAEPAEKAPAQRIIFPFSGTAICDHCGRDISGQRTDSRFCAEKHFGPTARRCRDAAHRARLRETAREAAAQLEALLPNLAAMPAAMLHIFCRLAKSAPPTLVQNIRVADTWGLPLLPAAKLVRVEVCPPNAQTWVFEKNAAKKLLRFFATNPPATEPTEPEPPTPPAPNPPPKPLNTPPQTPKTPAANPNASRKNGPFLVGSIADEVLKNIINKRE